MMISPQGYISEHENDSFEQKNIWIDTDPGIDDALALAIAASENGGRFNIVGISSCGGNQTLEIVTENMVRISSYLGLDNVTLVRGTGEPLVREKRHADEIHGENGLGNVQFPKSDRKPVTDSPFLNIRNRIMELPEGEKITFVTLAPLSNIAILLRAFPEVKEKIEEIIMMGGSGTMGNVTPWAEFNVWGDPEAAHIVFASGLPIVMCGLNTTEYCGVMHSTADEAYKSTNPLIRRYAAMWEFEFTTEFYRNRELLSTHDAVTVMYLLHPEFFEGERVSVKVDCGNGETMGRTVCTPDEKGNVFMLTKADQDRFENGVMEILNKLAVGYDDESETAADGGRSGFRSF